MNQRIEIVLETTSNERLFRFCLPAGTSYDEGMAVADAFKDQMAKMKQIHIDQQAAAQAAQDQASATS